MPMPMLINRRPGPAFATVQYREPKSRLAAYTGGDPYGYWASVVYCTKPNTSTRPGAGLIIDIELYQGKGAKDFGLRKECNLQ